MSDDTLIRAAELIRRPFTAEAKSGYANRSVFGGLDTYVLRHVDELRRALHGEASIDAGTRAGSPELARLREVFGEYGTADPDIRARLLREATHLLDSLSGLGGRGVSTLVENPGKKKVTTSRREAAAGGVGQGEPVVSAVDSLLSPVTVIKGVARSRAETLKKLGLSTVEDVLFHFPRRYEDMRAVIPIGTAKAGDRVTLRGRVLAVKESRARARRGLLVTKAVVSDETGEVNLVWFSAGYRTPSPLLRKLREADEVVIHGETLAEGGNLVIRNPEWDTVAAESPHMGGIVPVYAGTAGIPMKVLRRIILDAVDSFADQVPELALGDPHLGWSAAAAVRELHQPASFERLALAKRRLAHDEALILMVAFEMRRRWRCEQAGGIEFRDRQGYVDRLIRALPYDLTSAQRRVAREIGQDMALPIPMDRLLIGDVGSGKTVIAAMALARAVDAGFQGALMAPTEILAEQHFATLSRLFASLPVNLALMTSGLTAERRRDVLESVADGRVHVVVGTHAVIQDAVDFANLGLVVADEQHRFGVRQRALLAGKGQAPDVLLMSATPIPRTLALSVYGDLEVSMLDEMPPGRRPIVTKSVRSSARGRVYDFLRQQLSAGHQAYLVCPFIEDSESNTGKSAVSEAERLARSEFAGYRVGLLHGQMSAREKDAAMQGFRDGRYNLLVTTTVVEVGVDVPNATVMVVENAERFGLAQLHQLRGRVGRGDAQSYCILVAEKVSPEAESRLQAMTEIHDGFRLAEEDLRQRGPGEFFGTRQSGLPELRLPIGEILGDIALMDKARRQAKALIAADPALSAPEHAALRDQLSRRLGAVLACIS